MSTLEQFIGSISVFATSQLIVYVLPYSQSSEILLTVNGPATSLTSKAI